MKKINLPWLFLFSLLPLVTPAAQNDPGRAVMEAMENAPSPGDMVSDIRMIMTDRRGGTRERLLRQAVRKFPEANLTVFLSPAEVRGSGLLGLKSQASEDQWLYLPALKRSRRIAPGNKSDSFMGSEFTYEDLQGYGLEDWTYRSLGQEQVDGSLCEMIEASPLKPSGYRRRILWIDTAVQLPRRVHFFNAGPTPEKVMTLRDITRQGSGWYAGEITMENLVTGKTTRLTVTQRKTDLGLPDGVFTLGTLESGRLP